MIRIGIYPVLTSLLVLFAGQPDLWAQAKAEEAAAPEFKEVYEAIRAHAVGLSEGELNRAAVQGLVSALGSKVLLLTNGAAAKPGEGALVSRVSLMEGEIAYIRVEWVGEGLAKAVREGYERLGATNKLKGVILDLRYAEGEDYAAAAAAADLFVKKEMALLKWGDEVARSKAKSNAITVPAAVLVNSATAGAAEALGAVMRETGAALLLGGKTAGRATVAQEFTLKNGDRLRIATAAVQLGNGAALPGQGIKPDITVEVGAEEERAFYKDAFKGVGRSELLADGGLSLTNQAGGTNRSSRRIRFNEAELMRERREGLSEADLMGTREREGDKPLVQDPALARALDLLKGLAVVRQARF